MIRMGTRQLARLAVLSCLLAGSAQAAPAGEDIDQLVLRAMETFRVPGMAVSVVYDGRVHYSAGKGITETGSDMPVTEHTLFQIASVSKAFTAAALGVLVDDGKVAWDAPVIDYLPEFRMHDPWVTREFTVRDLLTHRSGLPLGAGDLLLFPEGKTTAQEVVLAMRHLKPSSSFRSEFAYDNLLYIVAGEVVARVSGMAFTEFLEQRVLQPLGMTGCTASLDRTAANQAKATPHLLQDGEWAITRSGITETSSAAGGVNCSAASMTAWMKFLLNEGETDDGERLLSQAAFAQLVRPITVLSPRPYMVEHAGSSLAAYALGWNVTTFHGQPMLAHSGGLWGMTSFIAALPRQGLAVFASNNQMSVAPRAVVYDILNRFLEDLMPSARDSIGDQDWIAIFDEAMNQRRSDAADEVARAEAARDGNSEPSRPLQGYAGTYRDDWYGDVDLELRDDGRLWFRSHRSEQLVGPLEHFQFDTFIVRWSNRQLDADAYVSFVLGADGSVERVSMKAVSPLTDFSYDFHDLDLRRVTR